MNAALSTLEGVTENRKVDEMAKFLYKHLKDLNIRYQGKSSHE